MTGAEPTRHLPRALASLEALVAELSATVRGDCSAQGCGSDCAEAVAARGLADEAVALIGDWGGDG